MTRAKKPSIPKARQGGPSPPNLAAVPGCRFEDGGLVCPLPETIIGPCVLLLDGRPISYTDTLPDQIARFHAAMPIFGRRLELFDSATGEVILLKPPGLPGPERVKWLGWTYSDHIVSGQFRLEAPPSGTPLPPFILVESFADGALLLRAIARPDADGGFAFSATIGRLIAPGSSVIIRPVLAGCELDHPLKLSDQSVGMIGHLDANDHDLAAGWAVDLVDRSRRVAVEIRLDGHVVGRKPASLLRDDLKQLGLSDGLSGFKVSLPTFDRTEDVTIQAFVAGTGIELTGSPRIIPALPTVIGCFDAVEGPFAGGWAVNMIDPSTPLELEAICDGEVIGSGTANLYRGDVENAGLPTPWCGFRFLLDRPLVTLFDRDIHLRISGTSHAITNSPRQISQNSNIVRFLTRSDAIPQPVLQRLINRMTRQAEHGVLSIVMPVYNTPKAWLIEALNSVLGQWCANWELICIDDASPEPHVSEILFAASRHDPRIHVHRLPVNGGIAAATNAGIRLAQGEFVAFMDHDDVIEPDAVHKLLMAAKTTGADLIYSDEAITTDDISSIIEVRARPAFSHDYYLSHPYFVHMIAVRTALAQRLGGWDETLPISADVDFVLRAIEAAKAVAHVPAVLYRWRTHDTSTGHARMAQVTDAMCAILTRHLHRLGHAAATVQPGFRYNEYRVDWPDDQGEVLIVIPTKNRVDLLQTCIDSIEKTSQGENIRIVVIDHQSTDKKTVKYLKAISTRHTVMPYSGIFNYALMNNLAVKAHGGAARHLLFLNNDVEALEDGWIRRLRSLSARPEVGAVGPLLLYGDDRIQHAGVLMAFAGAADHAMKFHAAYLGKGQRHPGYNCNLTSVRDYSAVTAACVMIRHDVFKRVKGFDESFVIGFNDTDLCLRIGDAGYKVLYDGFTVLYHHESATRTESKSVDHPEDDARLRKRWVRFFKDGDPFYSPLLAPRGTDHVLRQDAGCRGSLRPRLVQMQPSAVPVRQPRKKAAKRQLAPLGTSPAEN